MDLFNRLNSRTATGWDYLWPQYRKRRKHDGKRLRWLARRRLKLPNEKIGERE
ncbi:hypothetical protein FACS1894184_20240 [Clostridia bacterium]|nr:hypothetical protein FACS1894184_20240 [Clostridia bacterium]